MSLNHLGRVSHKANAPSHGRSGGAGPQRGMMMIELLVSITMTLYPDLPVNFVKAIALTENPTMNPKAIHKNRDGSIDYGLMQLNSSWYDYKTDYPERNIREACKLMRELRGKGLTWWQVAVAYNCGYTRFRNGPPNQSITYANTVFEKWQELNGNIIVRGGE